LKTIFDNTKISRQLKHTYIVYTYRKKINETRPTLSAGEMDAYSPRII